MEKPTEPLLNNRYRMIRELGKGGMGAVYLAYDNALEHEVAIKMNLQAADYESPQFLREARLLARLRHPNLPRVIDYFLFENKQCLVMDYIPGKDLRELLDQEGPLPLEKVLNWAVQLGSALTYLHNQNPPVIHRDIKPANIKLTPDGDVILVDFGIAKASDITQATTTGAYGYTLGYAPPEQYGHGRSGPYSDQFSLAATLYTLLSGHSPSDAVQRALGEAVLTPLNLVRPDVPKNIQATMERALSVKLEDRFSSIEEFISNLTQYNLVTRKNEPEKKQKSPGKTPNLPVWLILLGIVFFMAVLLGSAGMFWGRQFLFPAPVPTSPVARVLLSPLSLTATSERLSIKLSPSPAPLEKPTSTALSPAIQPLANTPITPSNDLSNGKMIAFTSDRADGKTRQIWTFTVQMSNNNAIKPVNPVQRTLDGGNKQDPAWSPDGSTLLYSAPGPAGNGLDIWKLDIKDSGSQPVRLTDLKGDDFQPAMSPDGNLIAFTHFDKENNVNRIYFMNNDGSQVQPVSVVFNESQPTWSPDGKWLFFVINAANHHYFYMYNLVDRNKTQKTTPYPTPQPFDNTEMFGRLGDVTDPAWSASGESLAYTRTELLTHRIYRVDFKNHGAGATLLTQGTFKESQPTWSPDGNWICFTSERDGNPEIYVMTSTGMLSTNLSNSPGVDNQPVWQP